VRLPDPLDRIAPPLPAVALPPNSTDDAGGPVLALDRPSLASAGEIGEPFLAFAASRRAEPPSRGWTAAERIRPPASPRQRSSKLGWIASVAVHLLPLLLLIAWPVEPAEVPPPIPVQLVIEQPKPPSPAPAPPPAPAPKKPPTPSRLASEEIGNPQTKQHQPGSETEPRSPKKTEERMVAALPPPRPSELPQIEQFDVPPPAMFLPPPVPAAPDARERQAMLTPPRPKRAPATSVISLPGAWAPLPAHLGVPGPAAMRDPYLAECEALIMRHRDLLPGSFVAGRRGVAEISIVVLADGRIGRISVARGSGFPDIDERVEKMVAAVGRFPPVPQRFQGDALPLQFDLPFD
jgi:periplasmic protein TonB